MLHEGQAKLDTTEHEVAASAYARTVDLEARDGAVDARRTPKTLRGRTGENGRAQHANQVHDRAPENLRRALAAGNGTALDQALVDVGVEEALAGALDDIVLDLDRDISLVEEQAEAEARLRMRPAPQSPYQRFGKRSLDIFVVLGLAPVWLPIYCLIALCLLIFQGRPIHYRAARPGRDGQEFAILKFRTMHADADQKLAHLLRDRPDLAEEFERHNKLQDDPRRTRLGALLRKSSLDEVPQLWNVLRGDMSIVGPRPPATKGEYDTFYGLMAHYIFQHRPGLTGLWQVSDRSLTRYERKIWFDMIYARRCSFLLDVSILLRTIPTVLRGRGAF